jgi:tRNA (guanine-N7-)-methyltransferase
LNRQNKLAFRDELCNHILMARTKLIKFKEIELSPIVIERTKPNYTKMKGTWAEFFGNNNPIVLELGCGSGEYTNGLAMLNPDKNYIGVDIKGERIGNGSRFARANGLKNVAFLRTQIQLLEIFFVANEVSEIWITFPDPQPNNSKQRLTSTRFLTIYSKILESSGQINLKTDSDLLFDFTLELLQDNNFDNFQITNIISTKDLYNSSLLKIHNGIQTMFEKKYLAKGEKIKYLGFKVSSN